MSLSIRVVSTKDGDWTAVLVNGSVDYEGHSIPDFYWINLLKSFGFDAKQLPEITTEQMQEGEYYADE